MFELKPLSAAGVPAALEKAFRYRMLNQPEQAESICHDVLRVDPANQEAVIALLLAVTDQFAAPRPPSPQSARDLLPRLNGEYERSYYAGLICERLALVRLRSGLPNAGETAHDFFREAMTHYERAEAVRPAGNDDPLLRWNSCVRVIQANPDVRPPPTSRRVGWLATDHRRRCDHHDRVVENLQRGANSARSPSSWTASCPAPSGTPARPRPARNRPLQGGQRRVRQDAAAANRVPTRSVLIRTR